MAGLTRYQGKETNAPSRGLLLPRVELNDVSVFQLQGITDNTEKQKAAGMTVYNLKNGTVGGTSIGIYVWDGEKWRPIKQCVAGEWYPSVTGSQGTYRVFCFNGGVGCWWIDYTDENGNNPESQGFRVKGAFLLSNWEFATYGTTPPLSIEQFGGWKHASVKTGVRCVKD
jgi:hypothetical protein